MEKTIIIKKIEEYEISMTEYQKIFYERVGEFAECNAEEIKDFFEDWDNDSFIEENIYPDYQTYIEIKKGEK